MAQSSPSRPAWSFSCTSSKRGRTIWACFSMWALMPSRSLRKRTCASCETFSGETRITEKAARISAMSAELAVTNAMPELGNVTFAVEPNS